MTSFWCLNTEQILQMSLEVTWSMSTLVVYLETIHLTLSPTWQEREITVPGIGVRKNGDASSC